VDRLQLINIFVTVVDVGGFAGAARKLNISAPVVTRAINDLEAHLGTSRQSSLNTSRATHK